ncbi:MAG: AAA family ATPase [Thermoplasmata archaeon]
MFNLDIAPPSAFTEAERDLIQIKNPSDLTPEERAARLELLLRPFNVSTERGNEQTALLAQKGISGTRNVLLRLIDSVADGAVEFPDDAFFPFLVRYVRYLLGAIRELNQFHAEAGGRPTTEKPGPHYSIAQLFGGGSQAWAHIPEGNAELIAARLIEITNPQLLAQVPSTVSSRLAALNPSIPPPGPAQQAGLDEKLDEIASRLKRIEEGRPSGTLGKIPRIEVPKEFQIPPVPSPPPAEIPPAPTPRSIPLPPASAQPEKSWESKYRPCHLDDIAGNQRQRNILRGALRTGVTPAGFLLWGVTGIGKTTAAEAFARDYLQQHEVLPPISEVSCPKLSDAPAGAFNEIRADSLPVDANAAREELAERLQNLAKYGSLTPGTKRIVVIDDINKLAPSVLDRLRPLLERYTHNVLFIFTANANPEKLLDPAILGRLTVLHFVAPDTASIDARLREIAEAEHIVYRLYDAGVAEAAHVTEEMVTTAGQKSKGDVRAAIGLLQAEFLARMGAP